MKIRILNFEHKYNNPDGVDSIKEWISPDEKYAIVEVFYPENFVAGKIEKLDMEKGEMTLYRIDELCTDTDDVDLRFYSVDWSDMPNGFFKLRSRSVESYKVKSYRFYFDPELYKQKYKELNGVEYSGNKKFRHGR